MSLTKNANQTPAAAGNGPKLYTGMVPLKIIAVNPSKKELEELFGREFDKEPEYVSKDESGATKVRLDFIVKTVKSEKDGCLFEHLTRLPIFIENRYTSSNDGSKHQVINAYGETSWATKENISSKKMPENMSFYNTNGMRAAYVGEERLLLLLKKFLSIPNRQYFNKSTNTFVDIKDVSKAEIDLNMDKLFKGDVKEISDAIKAFKDNMIKVPVGIKSTDDNKQYLAFYPDGVSSFNTTIYTGVLKKIKDDKSRNRLSSIDFGPEDLKFREYSNEPTNISAIISTVSSVNKDDNEFDPWKSTKSDNDTSGDLPF